MQPLPQKVTANLGREGTHRPFRPCNPASQWDQMPLEVMERVFKHALPAPNTVLHSMRMKHFILMSAYNKASLQAAQNAMRHQYTHELRISCETRTLIAPGQAAGLSWTEYHVGGRVNSSSPLFRSISAVNIAVWIAPSMVTMGDRVPLVILREVATELRLLRHGTLALAVTITVGSMYNEKIATVLEQLQAQLPASTVGTNAGRTMNIKFEAMELTSADTMSAMAPPSGETRPSLAAMHADLARLT